MIVKPETYKQLVAIKNEKIVKISNIVLRKIAPIEKQNNNLTDNSVCIVCNFRFMENKIEWSKKIRAICHPFRKDDIFPSNIKKYLFSESDFCDKLITCVDYKSKKWDREKYDFVYFTLISREGTRSKGLYLLPLINEISKEFKLKGLVVNYATRETKKHEGTIYHKSLNKIKKNINKFTNLKIMNKKYSCEEVCAIMKSSKFVLLPSDADASPRLVVESIVRDTPIVVNSSIYGGWKYINKSNGVFFNAPSIEECFYNKYEMDYDSYKYSLRTAIEQVLDIKNKENISKEFYRDFGFVNSSERLAKIINKISGTDYKAVSFREWEKSLKKAYGL